jgi:hypothetical protein
MSGCQDVMAFETKRFEVAQPKLTEDKVLEIWQTAIPSMKAALVNCQEKGGVAHILQQLLAILIKMEKAIERNTVLPVKIKAVAQGI